MSHAPAASALVQHRAVPWPVRLLLPVCLLGNGALFLSGHLSLGAEVDLRVRKARAWTPADDDGMTGARLWWLFAARQVKKCARCMILSISLGST